VCVCLFRLLTSVLGSDYPDLLTFYSSHFAISLGVSRYADIVIFLPLSKNPCILLGELLSDKKMCYYRYHYYSRCNHQELLLFRFCDRATELDPDESPSDGAKTQRESVEEGASHTTLATQNNPSLAQTSLITTQPGGAGTPGSDQHDPSFKGYQQRPHDSHHYSSHPYQSTSPRVALTPDSGIVTTNSERFPCIMHSSSNMANTVSIHTSSCLLLEHRLTCC